MELSRSRLDLKRGTWAQTESGPLVACPECGHASVDEDLLLGRLIFNCPTDGCDFSAEIELVEELTPPVIEPEPEPEPEPEADEELEGGK